jgi:hypothetical protein
VESGHWDVTLATMHSENTQRLVAWEPTDFNGRTPSFGDIVICSPQSQQLSVTLPFEEGDLRIEFKNARAFMSSWDGDPNPFLTIEEAASRPSDLLKVENSRWLASCFSLDVESSLQASDAPWTHFWIVSGERSLHVAARDEVQLIWNAAT